jgi:hypothetical protein
MGIMQMLMGGGAAGASGEGGDAIIDTGTHWIHVFTSPGNFVIGSSLTVEYFMVGGGGGSSSGQGAGGGGAGAFIYRSSDTLPASTYQIVIGTGGTTAYSVWPNYYKPTPGTSTTFNSLTASGGGGGSGNYPSPGPIQTGIPGASGGGGTGEHSSYPGGSATSSPYPGSLSDSPTSGWGSAGAAGQAPWNFTGGGGGGAASAGTTMAAIGGSGGDGIAIPWMPTDYGTPGPSGGRYFAGGGGGMSGLTGPQGFSGSGIPGWGSGTSGSLPSGGDNTGGGGGGTILNPTGVANPSLGSAPFDGFDGIIAIRYPK